MLEPRNDEERKALRLAMKWDEMDKATAMAEIKWWLKILAEARSIILEEQGDGSIATPHDAREFELAQIRADITRTAAVGEFLTLASDPASWPSGVPAFLMVDCTEQTTKMHHLLVRERELMAKSEPEGGK